MEQIIQSIQNQNCVLWLGTHINSKNKTVIHELAKENHISIFDTQNSLENIDFTTNHVLLIIEPDFFTDMSYINDTLSNSEQKPRIFFLCNQVNQFALPITIQKKYVHIKKQSKDLIKLLEKQGSKTTTKSSILGSSQTLFSDTKTQTTNTRSDASKKGPLSKDPIPNMVGRDDLKESFLQFLQEDGPAIWLTGDAGIGKRTLLENSLAAWNSEKEITRLIDVSINSFVHVDALLGRIALAARSAGDNTLYQALRGQYSESSNQTNTDSKQSRTYLSPTKMTNLVIQTLQKDVFSRHVLVINNVQRLLHKNNLTFANDGLMEMLLQEFCTKHLKMRIVFISTSKLEIANASSSRCIHVEGLNQEASIAYAKNYGTSFPDDSEIQNQLLQHSFGHPMAIREIFSEFHKQTPIETIMERQIGSYKNLNKIYKNKIQQLDSSDLEALHKLFYYREIITYDELSSLDISKNTRVSLLHKGFLEKVNLSNNVKGYYIHPIAKKHIPYPEHGVMEQVAQKFLAEGKNCFHAKNFSRELFYIQEANALFSKAKRGKSSGKTLIPFTDPFVASIQALIRKEKYTQAQAQLSVAFRMSPQHPNLYLLEIELLRKAGKTRDEILQKLEMMKANALVADTYITKSNYLRDIRSDQKAMICLEEGIQQFPNSISLLVLASKHALQIQNHAKSLQILTKGIENWPKNPILYTLVGANLLYLGKDQWERAQDVLQQADTLYQKEKIKTPPFHQFQLAHFHRLQSYQDNIDFEENIAQSETLLRHILEQNPIYTTAIIELITVLLDRSDSDGLFENRKEELQNLIKRVGKINKNLHGIVQKARFKVYEGNIEEAMTLLDKGYALNNSYHPGFYARGVAFFAQKAYVRSLNAFRSALNQCPENSPYIDLYQRKTNLIQGLLENTEMDFEELARENAALHPTSSTNPTEEGEGFRTEAGMVRRRTQNEP